MFGNVSQFFNRESGCGQGDTLSPFLFITGVDLLAIQLKGNQILKGVNINGNGLLITQYADDTFLNETLSFFEKYHRSQDLK